MAVDVNGDGKPDVYVANDTTDNFVYTNVSEKGKIRFRDVGLASGTARDDSGAPNGSMGLDVADHDRCGKSTQIDKRTVSWPSGEEQVWTDLNVDRYWRLIEGEQDAYPARGAKK